MSIHFVRTLLSQSRNLPYQLEVVSFITNIKFAVSLFSNVLPEHCFLCGVLHPTDKYFALASLQKLQMQNVGGLSSFENIVVLCTGTMNGGAGLAWPGFPFLQSTKFLLYIMYMYSSTWYQVLVLVLVLTFPYELVVLYSYQSEITCTGMCRRSTGRVVYWYSTVQLTGTPGYCTRSYYSLCSEYSTVPVE